MSSKIKKKKTSPVIKTLQWLGVATVSALLIIYFVVVDTRGGQSTPVIGSANGKPIYYSRESAYGRAYTQLVDNYKAFGINPDGVMLTYIEDIAFRNAVASILMEEIASKNIRVSDSIIVDAMKSQFVDTNGVYNQAQYDIFLRDSTQSEKMRAQNEINQAVLLQTLQTELFLNVKMSTLALEREFKKKAHMRMIEMVYIDVAEAVSSREPDAADLTTFFESSKTNFIQADVSWISVQSGSVADSIYQELSRSIKTNLSSFETAALQKSEDTNSKFVGGKIGFITKFEMPSVEIADSVLANNKPNTLLKPIYANDMFYIVLVRSIRLPEKIADVNQMVLKNEYFNKNMDSLVENEKIKQLAILSAAVANVENLYELKEMGFKYYESSEPFTFAQGRVLDIENGIIPDSHSEEFYKHSFMTEVGGSSGAVSLENGVAVINVLSEELPNMTEFASLEGASKTQMKRSLQEASLRRVQEQWIDVAISSAKIKRKNLR